MRCETTITVPSALLTQPPKQYTLANPPPTRGYITMNAMNTSIMNHRS